MVDWGFKLTLDMGVQFAFLSYRLPVTLSWYAASQDIKGVMTWSMVDALSELCSPFGLFPQTECRPLNNYSLNGTNRNTMGFNY